MMMLLIDRLINLIDFQNTPSVDWTILSACQCAFLMGSIEIGPTGWLPSPRSSDIGHRSQRCQPFELAQHVQRAFRAHAPGFDRSMIGRCGAGPLCPCIPTAAASCINSDLTTPSNHRGRARVEQRRLSTVGEDKERGRQQGGAAAGTGPHTTATMPPSSTRGIKQVRLYVCTVC